MKYSLFLLIIFLGCTPEKKEEAPLPLVKTVKVEIKDSPLFLEYVGHVEPYLTVQVNSQVEGIMLEKKYVDGAEVKKGDLLFLIDPRPYQADLAKAEAAFAQNLANLNYAKETVKRYAQIVKEDYIAQTNYDQYVTNAVAGEATTEQNQSDIERAKLNIEYCNIRAPMDAITGLTKIQVGNLVRNAGDTPLVILNQISPIFVNFYIPEKDLPIVRKLQGENPLETEVFINQDYAFPIKGMLTLIDNQVDEATGSILLQATFENSDKSLWPKEYVDVRLILGEKKGARLLPSQAVQYSQKGPYVFVVKKDSTVEFRSVTLGQNEGDKIIIESGLEENEIVVLEGQINLTEGTKVRLK